jgi:hypothetical protein
MHHGASTASAWDHVPGSTATQRSTSDQLRRTRVRWKVTRALLELPLWGANKSTTKTMRLANYCMRVRQLALMTNDLAIVETIFSNRAQVMEVVRQLNPTPRAPRLRLSSTPV